VTHTDAAWQNAVFANTKASCSYGNYGVLRC